MKRIPLLIALAIFLLIAAIIFIYDFKQEKKKSPWEFIGQNVVLVYSSPESSDKIAQQVLHEVTDNTSLSKDVSIQSSLNQLLKSKNTLISLNVIAKDKFDFTFFIPLSSDADKKRLSEFQTLLTSKKIEKRQRTFEGAVISEIVLEAKKIVAFIVIDDILVVSSTSFLVEDAVRISSAENPVTFQKNNSKLFQLSTSEKDDGDIYVNLPEFFRWIGSFSGKEFPNMVFGKSVMADLKIDEENALFNGLATDSIENGTSLLTLFNKQTPVEFEMKSVISTNSAAVLHYGISQPEMWYANRDGYLKNQKSAIKDSLEKLSSYKFSAAEFYKTLGNEVGVSIVHNRSAINSVFITKLKTISSGISSLEKLSETVSIQHGDSIYSEQYSTYTIRKIDLPNFTYNLFWPLANASSETYFSLVENYVLFSESDELLKEMLDDIDEENTWSKSLRWNTFLQTTLRESNVDLFFDVNLLSSYLSDHLTTSWKSYLESTNFLTIDRGAIQFSKLEQDYYFAGNFPLKKNEKVTKTSAPFSGIKLSNELTTKPFLVKNHDTGNSEFIVQDTLNTIYLVGLNGKVAWKLDLDSKIVDEVAQIDFYKNGKLQYLFITKNKLHVIDRLGRYVKGYPKLIDTRSLKFLSIVDYDKSKNYRFLISDDERRIFILDKEGKILDGWNPKRLLRNLFASARHYRILGKDYFVAIQDDGLVSITNRRGELIKGFPLSLHVRPEGDYFFEGGKDLSSSAFTIVSREGMKIRFNLLGKVIDQEALIKANTKSHFYLLVSDDNKLGSFVRIDESKIAAFDQLGKLLFEKENPGSEILLPHLFNFNSGKRIFSFTDVGQKLSYVWDERGNSILTSPMETRYSPTLNYNQRSNQLSIFWVNDNSIASTSLTLSN